MNKIYLNDKKLISIFNNKIYGDYNNIYEMVEDLVESSDLMVVEEYCTPMFYKNNIDPCVFKNLEITVIRKEILIFYESELYFWWNGKKYCVSSDFEIAKNNTLWSLYYTPIKSSLNDSILPQMSNVNIDYVKNINEHYLINNKLLSELNYKKYNKFEKII